MPISMKKETFYKWAIGILLVLNLIQIVFFFFGKPPHPPKHHRFHEQAMEILHLEESQTYQFHNFTRVHHKNMQMFNAKEKELIELYFETPLDDYLHQIHEIQTQKIQFTEEHFKAIYDMLNEDQKVYFNAFKSKALGRILR